MKKQREGLVKRIAGFLLISMINGILVILVSEKVACLLFSVNAYSDLSKISSAFEVRMQVILSGFFIIPMLPNDYLFGESHNILSSVISPINDLLYLATFITWGAFSLYLTRLIVRHLKTLRFRLTEKSSLAVGIVSGTVLSSITNLFIAIYCPMISGAGTRDAIYRGLIILHGWVPPPS